MQQNFKLHAIAIGSICLIVIVLFAIMRPKEYVAAEVSPYATGDRYVRIDSATWGQNCNPEINRLLRQPRPAPTNGEKVVPPQPVRIDNVLMRLGELCNGRTVCEFGADSETLQTDPLSGCFKQLDIRYRCYSIDRLWRINENQGAGIKIDCNEAADAQRKQ